MNYDLLSCQIKYDGPALQDHTIDVNKLAPALLSFSEAMTKISRHVDPEKGAVCNIKIKAFKEGCFISDLIIESIQENPEEFAGVIGTIFTQASSNVEVLYTIFVDIVKAKLFKKRNENKEVKINLNIDNSVTYEVYGDNNAVGENAKISISKMAHELYEEKKIEAQLKDIVAPLSQEKIESLHVSSLVGKNEKKPVGFDINEDEKGYFYGEDEIRIMEVKVKGYIENMHKKYRTFGLVDKNFRRLIVLRYRNWGGRSDLRIF